jgi:type IV secretion system protein VirB4
VQQVLEERACSLGVQADGLTPEQWLDLFYAKRKGSGKGERSVKQREAKDVAIP